MNRGPLGNNVTRGPRFKSMPRYERGYMAADFGTEISGLSVYRGDMDERRSAATVPREVGDHKRLVIFIADLQLSNPREATGVKFLNEAEAGHKSYVTIDFVPSSRSSAQKRSVVHHPATSSASCRSGSTYRPAHRPVLNRS